MKEGERGVGCRGEVRFSFNDETPCVKDKLSGWVGSGQQTDAFWLGIEEESVIDVDYAPSIDTDDPDWQTKSGSVSETLLENGTGIETDKVAESLIDDPWKWIGGAKTRTGAEKQTVDVKDSDRKRSADRDLQCGVELQH